MQLQKGDTVRLAQSVTTAEFGLALCDDDGAGLEIDGVVVEAVPAHGDCAHTAVDAPQPDYRTNRGHC